MEIGSGPLRGVRVLDVSRGIAGAVAGMLLADCGASVLRVEPVGGDPLWDELPGYAVWHRGKRVVEVDLTEPRAREAVLARLPATDILLDGLAPGTLDRFGLGDDETRPLAPGLVRVSISGHGLGPGERERPGFDGIVQARAGVVSFQGAARGRPELCTYPWPSFGAGMLAAIGALAALERRAETGRGCHVDTSLLDGVLAQSTMFVLGVERPSPAMAAAGPRPPGGPPTMAIYRCGDGRFLHIQTGARGALDRLFEATGLRREEFVGPRTGRHFAGDPEGAERFRAALAGVFAAAPRDEWVERLARADVPAAACLEPGEALRHAQVRAVDLVHEQGDPVLGPIETIGLPLRFARHPGAIRGPALRLGRTPNPEAALRHAGWPRAEELGPGAAGRPIGADLARPAHVPLRGLRILDLGMFAAGPYAAMLLADLGAEVVKLEPLEGDTMRPMERNFPGLHRGKRGLALDLKSPASAPVVERLARWADVAIHNMRPGVAERLGIGRERLQAWNPRLIYCHNTAWGSSGPMAGLGGFDQMYQAFCGMEAFQGGEGNPPELVAGAPLDYANALLSAAAVLMALRERRESGVAEAIECPQLAAGLFAMSDVHVGGEPARRHRLAADRGGYGPGYGVRRTADGWIFVCCPDEEARRRLDAAIPGGAAGDLSDAPTSAWQARFAAAGVPCEPVRPALGEALLDDAGVLGGGRVVEMVHPVLGRMRQAGGFVRFDGRPAASRVAPPGLGEHTGEILAELGFSPREVDGLHRAGAVSSAERGAASRGTGVQARILDSETREH